MIHIVSENAMWRWRSVRTLRALGLNARMECGSSRNSQMRYALVCLASYVVIGGEVPGTVWVKNMETGEKGKYPSETVFALPFWQRRGEVKPA